MGVHKYQYNFAFFLVPSEELYYFLGFVAADGYVNDEGIEIAVNNKDRYLLERFRDMIVPDKPISEKSNVQASVLKLSMRHQSWFFKDFYGLTTNIKWRDLQFPSSDKISDDYIRHFIRGYVDGDGTIDSIKGYRSKTIYIGPRLRILGNHQFLTDMNDTIRRFIPHNTNAVAKKGNDNIYTITYNFSTAHRIMSWLYEDCTICLQRKLERYREVIVKKKI